MIDLIKIIPKIESELNRIIPNDYIVQNIKRPLCNAYKQWSLFIALSG